MTKKTDIRPQFWLNFPLAELTQPEWEMLCDGCGACCLIKFEDDDVGEVIYTDVACQLMDCQTASCRHYAERRQYVPDCISLDVEHLAKMPWLPETCAYKRLYLGKPLPKWHHLLTHDRKLTQQLMMEQGVSVAGRCVSEKNFSEEETEERVIYWIKQ